MIRFKLIISSIILTAGSIMAAQAQESHHVVNVGDFTYLNIIDNLNVEYSSSLDSAGYVAFDSSNEIAKQMIFKNDTKGKLSIQATYEALQRQSKLPLLKIYSSALSRVSNNGTETVHINNLAPTPIFKASLGDNGVIVIDGLNTASTVLRINTGKGSITAHGKTAKLKCMNLGTGTIDAGELKAQEINCSLIGTGTIYCHSTDGKLQVKGTGTGSVIYKGTPSEIKVKKLGPLKVVPYRE